MLQIIGSNSFTIKTINIFGNHICITNNKKSQKINKNTFDNFFSQNIFTCHTNNISTNTTMTNFFNSLYYIYDKNNQEALYYKYDSLNIHSITNNNNTYYITFDMKNNTIYIHELFIYFYKQKQYKLYNILSNKLTLHKPRQLTSDYKDKDIPEGLTDEERNLAEHKEWFTYDNSPQAKKKREEHRIYIFCKIK